MFNFCFCKKNFLDAWVDIDQAVEFLVNQGPSSAPPAPPALVLPTTSFVVCTTSPAPLFLLPLPPSIRLTLSL